MNEHLLELADDELVIGWRDSEWTGIAPVLEEGRDPRPLGVAPADDELVVSQLEQLLVHVLP